MGTRLFILGPPGPCPFYVGSLKEGGGWRPNPFFSYRPRETVDNASLEFRHLVLLLGAIASVVLMARRYIYIYFFLVLPKAAQVNVSVCECDLFFSPCRS